MGAAMSLEGRPIAGARPSTCGDEIAAARMLQMTSKSISAPRKGSLAAIVGVPAAALLLVLIPKEESGRTVKAEVAQDGTAKVQHVSGRQYLRPYLDIAGVATACDGITRGVRMGQAYTEAQCAAMLESELVIHAQGAMKCTPGLSRNMPYQVVPAAAHAYQFGIAGYCGSSMARNFNQGRIVAACDAFPLWNKARVGGKLTVVSAIERRGRRNREYCLTGTPGYPAATLPARLERWH
jgi:lysozyme